MFNDCRSTENYKAVVGLELLQFDPTRRNLTSKSYIILKIYYF